MHERERETEREREAANRGLRTVKLLSYGVCALSVSRIAQVRAMIGQKDKKVIWKASTLKKTTPCSLSHRKRERGGRERETRETDRQTETESVCFVRVVSAVGGGRQGKLCIYMCACRLHLLSTLTD